MDGPRFSFSQYWYSVRLSVRILLGDNKLGTLGSSIMSLRLVVMDRRYPKGTNSLEWELPKQDPKRRCSDWWLISSRQARENVEAEAWIFLLRISKNKPLLILSKFRLFIICKYTYLHKTTLCNKQVSLLYIGYVFSIGSYLLSPKLIYLPKLLTCGNI